MEIDTKIPGSQLTVRNIVLSIKDRMDGQQVFNSNDLQYKSINTYNITFRPGKQTLAYQFCNSLSTYICHQYPNVDLTRILTLEAIEKGKEETYHYDTHTFTTQEDIATKRELDDDAADHTLNFIDWSGLEPLDDAPTVVKPLSNPKLF